MSAAYPPASKPLSGLRVLEFAQIAAGPFTGCLLADLGADVVKVERPDGGDGMRGWPPLHGAEDGGSESFSGNFSSLNRNKRSVALDIKNKDDLARLYALVENADVFVENFRPGALARSGLSYEDLKKRNPRLVYCSITGYGQNGPYAQKGAFDVTGQAMSGLMSVTGEADGPPVKCGVPVGDFATGLYAAFVILAAVMRARETGEGAHIDCSILGSLLGISALQTSEYFGTGKAPRRLGSAHPRNAPYAGFEASDKPFTIAAGNDKLWRDTCAIVGRPDLPDDPRFATQSLRARHQDELTAILQLIFSTRTAAEWLADFDAKGVPCAPINDFADILHDPHVRHAGWVRPMTMPNGARAETVGFPVAMTGYSFEIERRPPDLGEHNDEVYREWTQRSIARAL
ncbi:CoA transferase [Ancylobacter sp. MQZ15Z-1]|uniref:CoA transferase n=1 Tax=Ancylobacter mangrovi TaxID=2972472 RepID=A0A9X2PC93_9HYPH|nr:CoA transferase [Ancylobacter mangrovi]MCS0494764.1 CoA transferase [Ancylobacter mangrovi]